MGVHYKPINKPYSAPNDAVIMIAKTCEEAAIAYFHSVCTAVQQRTDNSIELLHSIYVLYIL